MSNFANGWLPISLFRPETFPGNEPFLVWMMPDWLNPDNERPSDGVRG